MRAVAIKNKTLLQKPPVGKPKKKILLVDDDWIFLQMLKSRLMRRGFEVVTAGSEKEFWEKAFSAKPDLIIVDLLLKNKMGQEVYRNLLRFGLDPGIPVIFMSAFVDEELKKYESETRGAILYSKSVDFKELVKKIQERS